MINLTRHGKILEPTSNPFENRAVLNPAVYQHEGKVEIIYRAIDEDFNSCLGYARLDGPLTVEERWTAPFLFPSKKEESKGIEDPRIVKIEDMYYMTYVVHDGKNAISSYSWGKDLFNLKKGGVISPKIRYKDAAKIFPYSKLKDEYYFFESFYSEYGGKGVFIWHKDLILFPEKINGSFMMLQRILPDIQLIAFDDFSQLKDKYFWIHDLMNLSDTVLLECEQNFESRHLGGGCPPIKTENGWLMIYHAAQESNNKRIYCAGAALLDLDDPSKVIARLPYPLLSPENDYELKGVVNNVVFPTGTASFDGELYIYYGAADKYIAVASIRLNELIDELMKHKK